MNDISQQVEQLSPQKRALLELLLQEKQKKRGTITPPAKTHASWQQPDWLEAAERWIHGQLRPLGRQPAGPCQPLRITPDGCMLRLPTTAGFVYLKAVPPFYAHEPLLTQMLAQQFPDHLPPVLAVESQQRWLLMAELPGQPLYQRLDMNQWQQALQTFARIQVHYVEHTSSLLAVGCFDRRLEKLTNRLQPFLDTVPHQLTAGPNPLLTPSEYDRVRTLRPQIETLCHQIAAGLPVTLDHGDFHPNNIYTTPAHAIFFDWADGAVAHPFFSPLALFGYIEHTLPAMRPAYPRLRAAYLQPWQVFRPLAELVEIFEAIRPLASLHYALNMHECLTNGPEKESDSIHEMEKSIALCLKQAMSN